MYIQQLDQEEDYALRHLDCGQPPDAKVFAYGSRAVESLEPRRADPLGARLQEAFLDDDSEAWSPPDDLMENE